MPEAIYTIEPVRLVADIEATAELFRAYASSLPIDLAYQDFESELASLPGRYGPPTGELLMARNGQGHPVGCVGLRQLDPTLCEMKRLYVSPQGRGLGLGKAFIAAIIEIATKLGYQEMRLDTLSTMDAAISLYQKAGFVEIPPYFETPLEDNIFMSRTLGV